MAKPNSGVCFSKQHLVLLLVSILTGGIAGFIGYLIGQYFYVLFVYPFILLAIGAILYFPLLRFLRTSSSLFNAVCGLLMGLMILFTFHYVEYSLFRSKADQTAVLAQQMGQVTASNSVDAFLKKETGIGGFLGFMKYQQNQDRSFIYYYKEDIRRSNSIIVTLHGTTAWLYLIGEGLVLLGGSFLFVFLSGKIPG